MGGIPILSLTTFLPAIGALVIMLISAATGSQSSDESESGGRNTLLAGTFVSLMTFAAAMAAYALEFDPSDAATTFGFRRLCQDWRYAAWFSQFAP